MSTRPVAWRVKDHADGWIIYQDEQAAYKAAEWSGALMQGLYVRDGSAPTEALAAVMSRTHPTMEQDMGMHPTTYEYLKPTDEQIARMGRVRAAAAAYSAVLETELPDGPDKTYIIRNHRSNAMWCNVSITRLPDGTPRT